ncbi:MAG: ribosome silencing factor [Pelagibacterales bacterium]|nr:ribosome silencing factor [Pelagibacterales bacterium]
MDKIFDLKKIIINTLDSNKALDIVSIDLENKSSMADYLIIASGTSFRHMQALSEIVLEKFKSNGISNCKIEGSGSNDWKLIDGIDVVVHIFNPEKRKFYDLEKMWSELIPKEKILI